MHIGLLKAELGPVPSARILNVVTSTVSRCDAVLSVTTFWLEELMAGYSNVHSVIVLHSKYYRGAKITEHGV
jgi:hypothetical protein